MSYSISLFPPMLFLCSAGELTTLQPPIQVRKILPLSHETDTEPDRSICHLDGPVVHCSETAPMKFPVAVDRRRERPLLTQSVGGKQSQKRTHHTPPQTLIKPVRGNKICSYTTVT